MLYFANWKENNERINEISVNFCTAYGQCMVATDSIKFTEWNKISHWCGGLKFGRVVIKKIHKQKRNKNP